MSELKSCFERLLIRKQIVDTIAIIDKRFGICYPTLTYEQKEKIGL